MRWHRPSLIIAVLLALLAAIIGLVKWQRSSHVVSIALPAPALSLANQLRETISDSERTIKARRFDFQTIEQAAAALESGKVEAAVVRSDVAMPKLGSTAVILRRDAVVLIAPTRNQITGLQALAGKSVGLVESMHGADQALIKQLLAHFGLADRVTIVPTAQTEIRSALASRRIVAVFTVAPTQSETIGEVLKQAGDRRAQIVAIPEADAISKRYPQIETMELARGLFRGTPPLPSETINTISVSWRYVAANGASKKKVTDVTRQIMGVRSRVNGVKPGYLKIEAPSTDKDAPLAVHPGAAAFFDDEPDNTFDRFESLFYLIMMSSGIFGSLLAAASGYWRHNVTGNQQPEERLAEIIAAVPEADPDRLTALEKEAGQQIRALLQSGSAADRAGLFSLMITEFRHAVRLRRREFSAVPSASSDGGQPRVH